MRRGRRHRFGWLWRRPLRIPDLPCVRARALDVRTQVPIPLIYENIRMEAGYRADIVVDGAIVVELKAVESLSRIHEAQLISHLRPGGFKVGLLINFHEVRLKNGIRRRVNRV
jgi:GxxExxY protein